MNQPPAKTDPWTKPVGILRYFGDPMCSWCWGLKPVLEQVELEYPELQRVIVMGGLRGGEEVPMDDGLAGMIQQAWHRIEEATGQPFNHLLWETERPLATTWPACRAVIAARELDPAREWSFMVAMFKAYFTRALNPSRRETHLIVAMEQGFDPDAFAAKLDSPEVETALQNDLRATRQFGVTGFPSVVLSVEEQHYLVAPGYLPIDAFRKAINAVYQTAGIDFTRPESGLYS